MQLLLCVLFGAMLCCALAASGCCSYLGGEMRPGSSGDREGQVVIYSSRRIFILPLLYWSTHLYRVAVTGRGSICAFDQERNFFES